MMQFLNNKKLFTMYPNCTYIELYIDSRAGKKNDFGFNYRILVLNVWNGQTKVKSITDSEEELIYQLKDKQVEKLSNMYNRVVIKNEIKKFKNNEYYPTTIEIVTDSQKQLYDLDTLTKRVIQPVVHMFE